MRTIIATIESLENNYSVYINELDGVVATGSTIEEIKKNLQEALEDFIETCKGLGCKIPEQLQGDYVIEFKMDVKSLLTLYQGIFSKAALHRLGNDLIALHL